MFNKYFLLNKIYIYLKNKSNNMCKMLRYLKFWTLHLIPVHCFFLVNCARSTIFICNNLIFFSMNFLINWPTHSLHANNHTFFKQTTLLRFKAPFCQTEISSVVVDRLTLFNIIGTQFKATHIPFGTLLPWWTEGFSRVLVVMRGVENSPSSERVLQGVYWLLIGW